jgi:AraC-like DNA-binding protein
VFAVDLDKAQRIFEYIDTNFNNKMKLGEVAREFHFNEWYFSKYFKKISGTTFTKYLNSIRINKAKAMLRESEMKITEISARCGYETIRTFNREFKSLTGITAMEYKKVYVQ